MSEGRSYPMFKIRSVLRRRPRRETVVVAGVCVIVGLLFFIATVAVHAYNSKVSQISRDWAQQGDRDLAAGKAPAAILEYRNALVYDARSATYQLHLAQALSRIGEIDEARAYLLHLWKEEPGDGVVNLELARLSERTGAADDAVAYLRGAIFGVWDQDPEQRRRNVRLELIRLLLQQKRNNQADAELISLLASLPRRADAYSQAGDLLLQAGDPSRALEQFRHALRLAPAYQDALRGAGKASFDLARLNVAQEYLSKAEAEKPGDAEVRSMLGIARMAHQMDPFGFRLSQKQRNARVRADFQIAVQRLQTCVAQQPAIAGSLQPQLAAGQTISQQIAKLGYLRSADSVDSTMTFVFDSESLAGKSCGVPQPADTALELIGRMRESR
jgi:tetratricopeptide (TPR) repeat protein